MTRAPFRLPAGLLERAMTLRPQTDADFAFLTELYVSVRWEELRVAPWTDAERLAFLQEQYARQHLHYTTHYTRSDFYIIEAGGRPIGRLCLDRGHPRDLRIVDVALLPDSRGGGIGTALIRAVLDEAEAGGKKTSIHVENDNPARRLYARAGFREVEPVGPYWRMETDVAAVA